MTLRCSLVALVALTACLESQTPRCGEALCPAPLQCVRPNVCIRPEALAACQDKQDSDVCQTPEGATGVCGEGVCIPDTCGDGRVSFGEVCDGADLGGFTCETFGFYRPDGLVCAADCGFDLSGCGGICGDGVANGSELCDGDDVRGATCQSLGYYYSDGLACQDSCFYDISGCTGECGDAVLDPFEYCDGSVPQGDSCLTFGFGAGQLDCSGLCGANFSKCRHLRWRTLDTYSDVLFHDVWVGDSGEMVAVGEGLAMHLEGTTWVERRFVALFDADAQAVWGLQPDDLWAATVFPSGNRGVVMRYNGTQWATAGSPSLGIGSQLYDIWGTSSSNVFAVGSNGIILHWNGSAWSQTTLGTDAFMRVRGTGPNNVYALSTANLYHYDGNGWDVVAATPAPTQQFLDMWFDAAGQLYVARANQSPARLDGTTWVDLGLPPVVYGASPSPGRVVGSLPGALAMLQYDGLAWTTANVAGERLTRRGFRLYATGGQAGQIHVFDGGSMAPLPAPEVAIVRGAWVSPTGKLYVAGLSGSIAQYDGVDWTPPLNVAAGTALSGIYGFADDDLWVIGINQRLRHCATTCSDPVNWLDIALSGVAGDDVQAIWGRNSDDMYVAAQSGRIYRISGGVATFEHQTTFGPAALHGTADRVIVVGVGGQIAIRQAGAWTEFQTTATGHLRAVCALANNDVWAFGDDGAVTHFDGTMWSSPALPTGADFVGCAGYAADDVLAVASGEVWHWNGETFSPVTPPFETSVTAVAPTPGGVFFASSYNDVGGNVTDVTHLFKPSFW